MIRDTLSKSGGDATLLSEAIVETEFPTTKVIVFVNTAESKDRAFLYTSPTSGDCTPTIQEMRERLPTLKRSLACHFTCVGQFEALTKPVGPPDSDPLSPPTHHLSSNSKISYGKGL
jgi:hypothetical protein